MISTPTYHYDIEQGSEEWLQLRSGRVTASVVTPLLAPGKFMGKFGDGAKTEFYRIIEEVLTGMPRANFGGSKGTDFGHEYERAGIELYELENFVKARFVGFVSNGDWIGCSPDALIGENGGVEVKCLPTQHIRVLETGTCKDHQKFVNQCRMNLIVTGRRWWDLIYYHPHFPERHQMRVFKVLPDKEPQSKLASRLGDFIKLLEERIEHYHINPHKHEKLV